MVKQKIVAKSKRSRSRVKSKRKSKKKSKKEINQYRTKNATLLGIVKAIKNAKKKKDRLTNYRRLLKIIFNLDRTFNPLFPPPNLQGRAKEVQDAIRRETLAQLDEEEPEKVKAIMIDVILLAKELEKEFQTNNFSQALTKLNKKYFSGRKFKLRGINWPIYYLKWRISKLFEEEQAQYALETKKSKKSIKKKIAKLEKLLKPLYQNKKKTKNKKKLEKLKKEIKTLQFQLRVEKENLRKFEKPPRKKSRKKKPIIVLPFKAGKVSKKSILDFFKSKKEWNPWIDEKEQEARQVSDESSGSESESELEKSESGSESGSESESESESGGEKSESEKSESEKSEKEKSEGEKSESEKSESEKSEGEKSEGEKSESEKSEDESDSLYGLSDEGSDWGFNSKKDCTCAPHFKATTFTTKGKLKSYCFNCGDK